MKYIIFDNGGVPTLVIFDSLRDHSDMARRVGLPVLSAGSISFELGGCVAGSVSLKTDNSVLQSLDDEIIVRKLQKYV
jgi:hypothetical protein